MLLKSGKLFALILCAIGATYFAPDILTSAFYIGTLVLYFKSKDEPFWFAFFLIVSDGFLGFFGLFDAVLSAIPGLPAIEVGHFYILLTVVKASRKKTDFVPFYSAVIAALGVYVVFLVIQGYVLGVSPQLNVHFRILKYILPLLAFYSIPRLFDREGLYREAFEILIPYGFAALFAQVFTISMGLAPAQVFGVNMDIAGLDIGKGKTYRGFYSNMQVLLTLLGSVYFSAVGYKNLNRVLLFGVMAANYLSAFLSATRGWVLSFSLIVILHLIVVLRMSASRLSTISITAAIVLFGLTYIPAVNAQFTKAFERILTVEALLHGDVSAGGTLERLDERSPKVMKRWEQSPLTGWGYSDIFFKTSDGHVGNQNILMHSGIIGVLLMLIFFAYFNIKIVLRSLSLPSGHPVKNALLVFPIFFLGWFFIHSTSGQQFAYYEPPSMALAVAYFFSFGAMVYKNSSEDPYPET